MSVTDAEKAFYQEVLAEPEGKSLADLRYAYFLAALDGGLPAPAVAWVDITGKPTTFPFDLKSVSGYNASVAQVLEHDASGNVAWVAKV